MTTLRVIRSTAAGLCAVCLVQPAVARAAEQALRISSDSAEQKIVVVTGYAVPGEEARWVGVLPTGGVVHRVRIEVVPRTTGSPAPWSVEVFAVVAGVAVHIARFDEHATDWSLPRPLGVRLSAGDSVNIRARLSAGAAPLAWRIVADYESFDAPQSRLAVLPFELAAAARESSGVASWEWRMALDGRLLAIAGVCVEGSAQLVLEDVESGVIVWREVVDAQTAAPGCDGTVVRAGVVLGAGLTYRLSVTGSVNRDHETSLLGYVMPANSRQLAAAR